MKFNNASEMKVRKIKTVNKNNLWRKIEWQREVDFQVVECREI